jgi:hypothetical protein
VVFRPGEENGDLDLDDRPGPGAPREIPRGDRVGPGIDPGGQPAATDDVLVVLDQRGGDERVPELVVDDDVQEIFVERLLDARRDPGRVPELEALLVDAAISSPRLLACPEMAATSRLWMSQRIEPTRRTRSEVVRIMNRA